MRRWLEKFGMSVQRWMYGRYGRDSLSTTLYVAGLLMLLCASIFDIRWLSAAALLPVGWSVFRMYSKNIAKRRIENDRWLSLTAPLRRDSKQLVTRLREGNTYRFYKCPKCRQTLRVPRGKGKIRITCKSCGEQFVRKS